MWRLDEILNAVNGTLLKGEQKEFASISTDSRAITRGELFIPLIGPNFDGHAFVHEACARSAGGSLCQTDHRSACADANGTIILVEDTTKALLALARFKRKQLSSTFVAITGSNGKTTTKELLVHIVRGFTSVAYNEKNYNNHIGVSQTLLAVAGQPSLCIFELGTNHPGEIATLAELVEPDLSLITNVHASHLEGLGDLKGVYKEKVSLFERTSEEGTILINMDDPSLKAVAEKPMRRSRTYAVDTGADFTLSVTGSRGLGGFDIELSLEGQGVKTTTPLLGRHNLHNVIAAAALAHLCGAPADLIRENIAAFQPYPGRLKAVQSKRGYTIIDDAYNANPASMQWAIETLEQLPCKGRKIAILGEMKELGREDVRYHRELGKLLKSSSLSTILFLGDGTKAAYEEMNNGRAKFFEDRAALVAFAAGFVREDDLVLVKGSRAMKMNEVVGELL